MKTIKIYIILLLVFSCTQKTETAINNPLTIAENQEKAELLYDYMTFDSLLIDCRIKPFSTYDTLLKEFGKPDTIIEYKNDDVFVEDPFTYINYNNIEFHKYENNGTSFYGMKLGETNNAFCYKAKIFNKSTTLNGVASLFPKSFNKKDTVVIGNEQLVSVRFHTSNMTTDSQWIMLFFDGKLKYFKYYDAND